MDSFKSADIGFVLSVFNELFVCVSTYDSFTASLASAGVAKWIILLLAILKSAAIAVFPSDPKYPLSPSSPFGSCGPVSLFHQKYPYIIYDYTILTYSFYKNISIFTFIRYTLSDSKNQCISWVYRKKTKQCYINPSVVCVLNTFQTTGTTITIVISLCTIKSHLGSFITVYKIQHKNISLWIIKYYFLARNTEMWSIWSGSFWITLVKFNDFSIIMSYTYFW